MRKTIQNRSFWVLAYFCHFQSTHKKITRARTALFGARQTAKKNTRIGARFGAIGGAIGCTTYCRAKTSWGVLRKMIDEKAKAET